MWMEIIHHYDHYFPVIFWLFLKALSKPELLPADTGYWISGNKESFCSKEPNNLCVL